MNRKHIEVSPLSKFRVVIAWALVLAFLVSGSAMAGAPGSGDGQLAAAAKKKKCKKGKKCKKKKPAAPVAPVAGAAAPAASPAPPPGDAGGAEDVLFDVTALSGTFDATVTETSSCTETRDAHWTAALGAGADPAELSTFPDDNGSPLYIFSASRIPYTATGTGTATETCNLPDPQPNGTASCTFQATHYYEATVSSDPEGSPGPMNVEWFFGYNSPGYNPGGTGANCTYSGPRPPDIDESEYAPGLFVTPQNDGSNLLEPVGKSSVPLSQFNGDTTLNFNGSASNSAGNPTLDADWQFSVSFHRR